MREPNFASTEWKVGTSSSSMYGMEDLTDVVQPGRTSMVTVTYSFFKLILFCLMFYYDWLIIHASGAPFPFMFTCFHPWTAITNCNLIFGDR